jgi:putative DNA primase/helicase
MGCSMLWLISVIVGNSMQIEVKKGWYEMANIWVAVVGRAGLGKTPSINNIIYPLQQVNSKKIKDYIRQYEKYHIYHNASEEQKKQHEHVKKPIKQQFIANDITLEALIDLHQESKNAIGVFKDELNGWFKDMNKYRAGSDLEFWLSSWSGKAVSMNRKSATSAFVDKPFIPVLGGIQPSILAMAYTDENKDNGFVDRMLLTYPDLEIEKYNTNEMRQDTIEWYQTFIVSFYDHIKHKMVDYDEDREIKPRTTVLTQSARKEWQRIFNEITEVQNSDEENEYMKSMLPKQKSYIPRFALLINTLDYFMDIDTKDPFTISKESMLKAEKLSKYFIQMAKKVKVNTMEHSELKTISKANTGKSSQDIFNEMYQANPNLNKKDVAELLGVSRQQIYNYIKHLDKKV